MFNLAIKTFVLLIINLIVSSLAFSAPKAHDFDVKVKFDHTFYSLKNNAKLLVYKEGPNEFSIAIKDCNRPLVNKITETYEALLLGNSKKKNQQSSKYDVQLIIVGGETLQIPRGDSFGTWLRDLPKQIMYHKAEAVARCRR